MNQLLLHHCCAPCSPSVVESFIKRFALRSFWFNPNIQPAEEYAARFESLKLFVTSQGLALSDGPAYAAEQWLAQAGKDPDRCAFCYRLRLTETAKTAKQLGIPFFSTTLLVSPYQKHELIRAIGDDVGEKHGVDFVYEDFRPSFYKGKDTAKKLGCYIQKYCGCLFSREEREKEKALRKTQKLKGPTPSVSS